MERLDVYLCDRLVGALERSDVGVTFRYLPEYLAESEKAHLLKLPAISSVLPLSERVYEEREVMAFFSNLLPDESVRRRIAEILKLSPEDTFGLLRIIGGDCAGAVAFWEPGRRPQRPGEPVYRELAEKEADDLLRNLGSRPLGIADDFRGISGAGAQDKLIACIKDGRVFLPLHGTPSTHIIKPDIERFPQSVYNEYFCMQLSARCGFETAECDILRIGGVDYYVTRRYDREVVEGSVRRLHQEDFCQLLRCRPEIKYQDQGGPSIVECARLLREMNLSGADVLSFVDRVVFNFLIGNGDAHGKNFSILYQGNRPRLAPQYDLICTTVYPAIAKKMAMKLDGKFEFRWVTPGKIVRTFARAGIGEKVVLESIARLVSSVKRSLPELLDEVNSRWPSPIYHDIVQGIFARIRKMIMSYRVVILTAFSLATLFADAAEWPVLKTYEDECLRRIRMPLGGVGTGTISLAGNGALVDWEIRNTPDRGFTPTVNDAATGFWLRTEDAEGKVTARLLEGPIDSGLYEGAEGASVPNHGFPRFRECVFKAAYPFAQVELADPAVPVRATLEAMNPLIPGDSAASGIPAALLRWKLVNPTEKPFKVSVLGFLVNAAGGECVKGPVFMKAREAGAVAGVTIGSADLKPVDTTLGQTSLAIPGSVGEIHEATVIRDDAWLARLKAFWMRFVEIGRAENDLPPMKHELKAVALSVSFTLAPGETKRVPFVLAWHFPHRYGWTKKNYRSERVSGPFAAENDLGNWYATKFTSSFSAALRLLKDLPELEAKTVDFVNGVLKSKVPDVIKEAALFNLSTLRSETCFRTADGHFYGWEGIFDDCGSCFGNCTHVWGYEHALIDLWPDLAKDMTELQFGQQLGEDGLMSFRVGLPLAIRARDAEKRPAADGQMHAIIKAYENWRKTKDDAWMKGLYPKIKKAMSFAWSADGTWNWDADKDGVMEGRQHNTMDVDYYGPNPQMEFLYLAALKAMAAMADAAGDDDFAAECRAMVAKGSEWTEKHLFNGSYYEHQVDGEHDYQLAAGCLIDQLVGDYAARQVGLGPVANEAHARTTLATILAKNASASISAVYNCGRDYAFPDEPALKMAWYPKGRMPKKPFPYYGENMTGFEYVVAASLAQRGDFAATERVVRDIRSRYDGRKRNPFDEAECGHHYVRALAAWSVLKAWELQP